MSAFTPRPWVVIKCLCGHRACRYYGTNNGSFPQGAGYSLEDARLIAAAPELHSAIDAALVDLDMLHMAVAAKDPPSELALRVADIRLTLIAALSKVKG